MRKQKKSSKTKVGILTGLALAGIAGAYFLYGTDEGKKQKKKITSLALKTKGEVLEKIEGLKDVSQEDYKEIVSGVIGKYKKLKIDHKDEIEKVSKELSGYWKHIKKHLEDVEKSVSRGKKGGKK